MQIQITPIVIEKMKTYGFQSNEIGSVLIILFSIHDGEVEVLDELDENNTERGILSLYKTLELRGIIKKDSFSDLIYSLTPLGIELISSLPYKQEAKKTDLKDFVANWVNLWKDDKDVFYKDGRRSLGCSEREAFLKFQSFFTDYNYIFKDLKEGFTQEDVVMGATKKYIEDFKKEGFKYCKGGDNFIWKQEGSTKDTKKSILATACSDYIANYERITTTENKFNKAI